jgi:glycolate oxidase FAD binding subunit
MSASTRSWEALADALGSLVGGRARAAGDGDTVAGVLPQMVVEPTSEEEVAAALAFANREGLKVLVRGGGTQLGMGFPPRRGDILLSTTRLAEVVEYNPHDLTVTVQAGIRLEALQQTLAQAGQWLALDPPLPAEATIGGVVATNATGARRLRYGGVRDQIIGVRVVTADGTIAKGGGKVVKNVAGYDLPKLFTGSLGTLGVIVAASFRLYPVPAASRTVALAADDPAPLCALAVRTIGTTLVPTALDVAGAAGGDAACTFAARFESEPAAADDQAARLLELAGELGMGGRVLEGGEEAGVWRSLDLQAPAPQGEEGALVVKVSLLPADVAGWLSALRETAGQRGFAARWRAHAGHGLVSARLVGPDEALAGAMEALRQAAMDRRGSMVVVDGQPGLLARVDVWGPSPALALMRRVKASFDPRGTLNPGRFIGRI